MSDTDDLLALRQAALSVLDMRGALGEGSRGERDRLGTTEARAEGFYWVVLGKNPPEIAHWERGEWWLAGEPTPRLTAEVTVASDRLVFKPQLVPMA
jgi:hypothetical protein